MRRPCMCSSALLNPAFYRDCDISVSINKERSHWTRRNCWKIVAKELGLFVR
eukprot:m.4343 g.4343  ORF g.4343 m.4343 type:complete len:52 (+) comp10576_c0_seq2:144-299(+)